MLRTVYILIICTSTRRTPVVAARGRIYRVMRLLCRNWGPTSTGTDYEDVNSSKHMRRSYRQQICTKCRLVSREITGTVLEVHIRLMTSAICGGTTHYYRYRCDKCRRSMGETTVPCPRPGNCPGLPLSMILLPK